MQAKLKSLYLLPIISSKNVSRSKVQRIKNECSFEEQCELVDAYDKSSHTQAKHFIYANPLPNSYELLGHLKKNEYLFSTRDIEKEINWLFLTIRKYSNKINLFLDYKLTFENSFLAGKYRAADVILSKIENEICFSIWTLEKRFLLLEFMDSAESHKKFLSNYNSSSRGFFTKSIAAFLSTKSEKNFSVLKYNTDSQALFADRTGDIIEANKEYYLMYVNFFESWKYRQFDRILAFDSFNSIVDRYLTLKKVLKILVDDHGFDDSIIHSRVSYLKRKINDDELDKLLISTNVSDVKMIASIPSDAEVHELFAKGCYDELIPIVEKKLIEKPSEFKYYFLYIESLINLHRNFAPEINRESFQYLILNACYNQRTKTVEPRDCLVSISRFCKSLSSFSISDGLHALYDDEFNRNDYWYWYNRRSVNIYDPSFCLSLKTHEKQLIYLDDISKLGGLDECAKFYKYKLDTKSNLLDLNIPKEIREFEMAQRQQKIANYTAAAELYEQLMSSDKLSFSLHEECLVELYNSYVKADRFLAAMTLYVENYMRNKYSVQRIQTADLKTTVRRNKFRIPHPTIDLPIFYSISNSDENEVHRAYEIFNESIGITRPSEIQIDSLQIAAEKLSLFLNVTCTIELFKHSDYIEGTKDGLIERADVCRMLQVISPKNSEQYKSEINELTNFIIIQDGIQQLDESKIYVNEQGLINSELREYEGLFTRYQTISALESSKSKIYIIRDISSITAIEEEDESIVEPTDFFSQDPVTDCFKEIFEVILDKFLNSKFGITAYLSTRIRHGVLLGEIRPVFEELKLIAQYDKVSESYREIAYWNTKYNQISSEDRIRLQKQLKSLSKKVDGLIYDLLKTHLQIRRKHTDCNGWFDYHFIGLELTLYAHKYRKTKDYQAFIRNVFEVLWYRTDKNLELIRQNLQSEIKSRFVDGLSTCLTDLRQDLSYGSVPEISTNITTCITEIQNAIDRVASWFNRSGSQTSDFTFERLINIVISNMRQGSRHLVLSMNVTKDYTIKGEYYTHIADLLRIFLENALNHSEQDQMIIPCEVDLFEENHLFKIRIVNSFPNIEKGVDHSPKQIESINLEKVSSEDKSGFHKAAKILKSDLRNEKNKFQIGVTEDGKYSVIVTLNTDQLKA